MIEAIQEKIKKMLAGGGVIGVLSLKLENSGPLPHFFVSADELSGMVLGPKWPLAKSAWRIAASLPEGKSMGLVCRGCDARAINEYVKAGQLRPGSVLVSGFPCAPEQAASCNCSEPFPPDDENGADAKNLSTSDVRIPVIEPGSLASWREHFQRCIKCYGCRNSCPMCICPECKLEDDLYVTHGPLPPDPLAFHLIRAMHLVDRCIGCGTCQDNCPSGLPLLAIHAAMREALKKRTGYVSGTQEKSPLLLAGRKDPARAMPAWEDTLDRKAQGAANAR